MSLTADLHLPGEKELTVPEVPVSVPLLKAGAFHLGRVCEAQNHEFMLCRYETEDPRACLSEGKAVTSCALQFFMEVKKSCAEEFTQYVHCLDKSSSNQAFAPCRKTQAVWDKCAQENMNLERLPYDYYSRVHVISSSRPKPEPAPPAVYPDATPGLPEDVPKPEARHGSRYLFMW